MAFKRRVMGLEEPPDDFLCSQCDLTCPIGGSGQVLAVGHHVHPHFLIGADSRLFLGDRVQAL